MNRSQPMPGPENSPRTEEEVVAEFADRASAEAIAGLLRSESVPARVHSNEPLPGLTEGYRVMVNSSLAHRARAVLSQPQVSDAELDYLATRELPPEDT